MLGYFVGEAVGDGVPVLTGKLAQPQLKELKHFGASAASAGDVEMYHIPGLTSEANTLEEALGGKAPEVEIEFGIEEWRRAYEHLNSTGKERHIDMVMLGCRTRTSTRSVRSAGRSTVARSRTAPPSGSSPRARSGRSRSATATARRSARPVDS